MNKLKICIISSIFSISFLNGIYLEYTEPKDVENSLHSEFMNLMKKLFNVTILVESGTYQGNTIHNAISIFDHIYSVELSQEFYDAAIEKFTSYNHVSIIHGSSDLIFNALLPTLNKNQRILFWLDGHYSGDNTALGAKVTPIKEELEAIKEAGILDSIILIDDLRDFFKNRRDHPTIAQLKQLILDINPDYEVFVYGDILIAFLKSDKIEVSPLIKLLTHLYLKSSCATNEIKAFKKLQEKFNIFSHIESYLEEDIL